MALLYIPGMSETNALNYQSPLHKPTSLARIGASMGIAAASIAILIFALGCFGLQAVFKGLPVVPLILATAGMILTLVGATIKKSGDDDTHLFLGMFVNLIGLIGAMLEIAVWMNWNLFYIAPTGS